MKKTILVVACVSLSLAFILSNGLAQLARGSLKERATVDKVLKSEGFTPALAIEGPSNSVWFIAARCIDTNTMQQVAVHMSGQVVNVQMEHYRRAAEGWQSHPMLRSGVTGDSRGETGNATGPAVIERR